VTLKRYIRLLLIVLLLAAGVRLAAAYRLDTILPLQGMYVDEISYSASPYIESISGMTRPPGMYVLNLVLGTGDSPISTRLLLSVLSILPASALAIALKGRRDAWSVFCVFGLALSPFLAFFGLQLLPAVPAAVLISFALLAAWRERMISAGLLAGSAALFRGELVMVPIILLLISVAGRDVRRGLVFAAGSAFVLVPVMAVNLWAGAGPVIAVNGGENLWLGSDWTLLTTPPGTEFEQLMSVNAENGSVESAFMRRAVSRISNSPLDWAGMGGSKLMAFLSIPGPGRNMETGWLLGRVYLFLFLPLTMAGMAFGIAGIRLRDAGFLERLALSVILTGTLSAVIFFPAARFRTSVLPAFWFLAAFRGIPAGRRAWAAASACAVMLSISLLYRYPGSERPGLTSVLAAERLISTGHLQEGVHRLDDAADRGYEGSDLHNLYGTALSLSGMPGQGLREFEEAVALAPGSPTLWRNYAVSLWNNHRYEESVAAARTAVHLNPLLRDELAPILAHTGPIR